MSKCRPGPHDAICGPSNDPYGEQCACGCSPSDWCDEQQGTVTAENFVRRVERFYALTLLQLGRDLNVDEMEEFVQIRYQLKIYLQRTTPEFFQT